MHYELIATLGPSSDSPSTWREMIAAGATAFRLNTSHLSLPGLHGWLEKLTPFLTGLETPLPLVLDLQGSKWRLGEFAPLELQTGQTVELDYGVTTDRLGALPVPHADFFRAAPQSDGQILLNDAKIELALEDSGPEQIRARVIRGGSILAHKGITFRSSDYRAENLSEKDQAILQQTWGIHPWGIHQVRYAISYIKDAAEMNRYRELAGEALYLIAKLERGPAMADTARIARSANELWLCRGDLGAELGLKEMAEAAARFSEQIPGLPVPSIMAGQVLEHMSEHPTPTRSEVCYLHDTLARGCQGFVLSDETAIGKYPVESCRIAGMFKTQANANSQAI